MKCKWCGEEAKYHFKNGEYCCGEYPQNCPEFKKKLSKAKLGSKRSEESVKKQKESMKGISPTPQVTKIFDKIKCSYGCNEIARYKFKNGKYCCNTDYRKCSGFINSKKITKKWKPNGKLFKNEKLILCSYGCNKIAKYKFTNGKYCCSEFVVQCKNVFLTVSDETKKKLSVAAQKPIEYWKETYPLFFKVEKINHVGDKLFVECKKCGTFFIPTYTQLYERIRNIQREDGGGDYFYCSAKCKQDCTIYNTKPSSYINSDREVVYTQNEYQQFRDWILERDDYKCQYCGKQAEHVHHERPQKLESFHALDPDLAWSVCKKCHFEKGHKEECSTGTLANIVCINN